MSNIDEHDMTKKMLNIIREGTSTGDAIDVSGPDLKDEQAQFMQIVSKSVQFNVFKVYPNARNVVMSGTIPDLNMEFQCILEGLNGLYINVNNMQLSDDAMTVLQHLTGYYKRWHDEWAQKLATDYKPRV